MNYQLVSIATILRDYIDAGYRDNGHEQLVDIADSIYNSGTKVDTMTPEYQKIYATQTPEFWALVFKDIKALDSQVSSHNVHDLLDDYKELLK